MSVVLLTHVADTCMRPYVLVSSTVFSPSTSESGVVKSVFSPEQRLEQTKETVASLRRIGYVDVLLLDNSGSKYQQRLADEFPAASVKTFDHFQYDNKGISETMLLLSGLEFVPDDRTLLKISGRYVLHQELRCDLDRHDLAARIYTHSDRLVAHRSTMATRCYAVKNKQLYRQYLLEILEEMYAYSARIVGLGSLRRWLVNQFMSRRNSYSYFTPSLSVEAASLRVVRKLGLRIQHLDHVGLTGLAGTFESLLIED